MELTRGEQHRILELARHSIERRFERGSTEPPGLTPALKEHSGVFVTLHRGEDLRGCIGYVHADRPLWENVVRAATASAFHDPRFPPVSGDEVVHLEIEISVLSPLRRISSIQEIRAGEHGIFLRKGSNAGLLLPQVASERNWDRETFLEHTCLKAGLPRDCWTHPALEIHIFTALVFNERQFRATE